LVAKEKNVRMTRGPVALVTGVGRPEGIGAAVVETLAERGSDVAFTWWSPYDRRVHGAGGTPQQRLVATIESLGRRALPIEADLSSVETPSAIFSAVEQAIGAPTILVLSHCESIDSTIIDTSIESFDRHFAVNARASWLLIREFGLRFKGPFGSGRIVSLTSDALVGNIPYGASKASLERITIAAAREFEDLGITANAVNPGPTDTGWMTEAQRASLAAATPLKRLGTPADCARLVGFLCSDAGAWINGKVLESDGGIHT
jgi:3-oxoacyl-[acyl-carrier protein] reductase